MTRPVVPARITIALDVRGLYGPEVDDRCGAAEPAVDMWEIAEAVPTPEQVALLATLTDFPVPWFYEPLPPGPMGGPIWMCYAGRRGCELVEPNRIDSRGVMHYGGEPDRTIETVQAQHALALFPAERPEPFLRPGRSRYRNQAREHLRKARTAPAAVQPPLPGGLAADEREALTARIEEARRKVRR